MARRNGACAALHNSDRLQSPATLNEIDDNHDGNDQENVNESAKRDRDTHGGTLRRVPAVFTTTHRRAPTSSCRSIATIWTCSVRESSQARNPWISQNPKRLPILSSAVARSLRAFCGRRIERAVTLPHRRVRSSARTEVLSCAWNGN